MLTRPDHSLIDQSLLARKLYVQGSLTAQFRGHDLPTNGDGFGIAWAGECSSTTAGSVSSRGSSGS